MCDAAIVSPYLAATRLEPFARQSATVVRLQRLVAMITRVSRALTSFKLISGALSADSHARKVIRMKGNGCMRPYVFHAIGNA